MKCRENYRSPTKLRSSVRDVCRAQVLLKMNFSGLTLMPFLLTIIPRNSVSYIVNAHFLGEINSFCPASVKEQSPSASDAPPHFGLKISISSM